MPPIGLRERKKLATREALSRAALELAVDRGVEAVTAEMIADAADVSTRTFHNYFSSKEDAILHLLNQTAEGLVDEFARRPATETVLDSLEAVLVGLAENSAALDQMIAVTRLMAEHPALLARHVSVHDTTSGVMVTEIARRTGTNPDTDLYPRLVYHAATAVSRAVAELFVTPGGMGPRAGSGERSDSGTGAAPSRESLTAAVRQGFTQLRSGLPQPSAR